MNLLVLISKYFWILAIFANGINLIFLKFKSQLHIQKNPNLEKGYSALFRGALFWLNIPWVVMGIAVTIGGVPNIWYFFRPQDKNPFVLAFFASIIIEWFIGTIWIIFRDGAQMLVTHPGMIKPDISDERTIKLISVGGFIGLILIIIFMATQDYAIPSWTR